MNVTALYCPNCGGSIDFDVTGRDFVFCPYCGQQLHLSDGEKRRFILSMKPMLSVPKMKGVI